MARLLVVVGLLSLASAGLALAQVNVAASPSATLSCAVDGGVPATLTAGGYQMTVTGADSYLCTGDTDGGCGAGLGVLYPSGTVMLRAVPGTSKSYGCRSSGSGVVQFTRLQ